MNCSYCNKSYKKSSSLTKHQLSCSISNISLNTDCKPFLKWVGGKSQLCNILFPKFPSIINNYYELFLGGGSILLNLCSNPSISIKGTIFAFDINQPLIYCYKNIQSNLQPLIEELISIKQQYSNCPIDPNNRNLNPETLTIALSNKENFYYWCRKSFNQLSTLEKCSIKGSALFLFLNKTCFRGLYREGPNGFNVPYGNYENPEIFNETHLQNISILIQPVIFECKDFKTVIKEYTFTKDDFIYCDPPYVPITSTSFTKYTKYDFTNDSHTLLFDWLNQCNSKFILSNSNSSQVKQAFTNQNKFSIETVTCKRSIHSKNPDAKEQECIIQNYI
jgi:DNA adenine methylase